MRRQRRRGRAARPATRAKVKGHLAAWNYFQSIDTPKNKEFVKKFKAKYGKDERVTDDPIEAAYMSVYFWKMAVEKAGSTDVDKVREAFERHRVRRPGRQGQGRPEERSTPTSPSCMGKIRDDKQFDIVYKTGLIEPDPYPQIAFPGWKCDWTKGGRSSRASDVTRWRTEARRVSRSVIASRPVTPNASRRCASGRSWRTSCWSTAPMEHRWT